MYCGCQYTPHLLACSGMFYNELGKDMVCCGIDHCTDNRRVLTTQVSKMRIFSFAPILALSATPVHRKIKKKVYFHYSLDYTKLSHSIKCLGCSHVVPIRLAGRKYT